jgi:hypothetical protein
LTAVLSRRVFARFIMNDFVRRAAPWTCAWMLVGLPAAHAAESSSPEQALSAPFEHYQRWRAAPLEDWRAANERVGAIGGWRTYLREAQQEGGDAGSDAHRDHPGH